MAKRKGPASKGKFATRKKNYLEPDDEKMLVAFYKEFGEVLRVPRKYTVDGEPKQFTYLRRLRLLAALVVHFRYLCPFRTEEDLQDEVAITKF